MKPILFLIISMNKHYWSIKASWSIEAICC